MFVSGGFRALAEQAFPSCGVRPSLTAVFLTVAALVAGRRLEGVWASLVVADRLGCLVVCEFFLDPGWNSCPRFGRQILDSGLQGSQRSTFFSDKPGCFLEPFLIPAYQDFAYLIYVFS